MNFIGIDVEQMLSDAKQIVEENLGRKLSRADPVMLLLKSFLALIVQQQVIIDQLAKENLLAYARELTLDKIGELVGCTRLPATKATCTVEVSLSAPRSQVTVIKQGTRVNAGDEVNFALDDELIFTAGETSKTAKATCVEVGAIGNDYSVGELSRIVDPQPFLKSIENITKSEGGSDIESDDSFRERIRQAPETFSTAGPARAYEYFTKSASSLVVDVCADTPAPGEVNIYPLLEGGALPDTEMLNLISEYLNDRERRPLTDRVFVLSPAKVEYDIELRYFISKSDAAQENSIIQAAEQAIQDFVLWQKSKLGRDINPTELYYRLRAAGVKRVEILQPTFRATESFNVACANNISATYAGLEDD